MTLSTTGNLKAGCECNVRVYDYNPTKANGLSVPWERFCRRATNGAVACQHIHRMNSCVSIRVATSPRFGCNRSMDFSLILYYDEQMNDYFTNYHTPTLYYQQLHLKYLCNLTSYWLQAPWGWHDSVETCRSVIIYEIIVHLLVTVQNNKRCRIHVLK